MVSHQMAFYDLAFFLTSQLVQDRSELTPNLPIQCLATILGDKDNLVFALVPRMRQTVVSIGHKVLLLVLAHQATEGELY
jgi:hypothetical protein